MHKIVTKITRSDYFLLALLLGLGVLNFGWVFSPALGQLLGFINSSIMFGIVLVAVFSRLSKHLFFGLILLFAIGTWLQPALASDSDAAVKQQIIKQSITSYSGNCPCPYNTARNGSKCGKRSAYSRPGGASPICFESDVTPEMVEAYKRQHKTD
jgi:hypothetical protein